jgi:hypothetical protein
LAAHGVKVHDEAPVGIQLARNFITSSAAIICLRARGLDWINRYQTTAEALAKNVPPPIDEV